MGLTVHLVDGTYELFRQHYGVPAAARSREGTTAGVRGVLNVVLALLEHGATHIGVATDQVIESFRNERWPGYKTGAGVAPELLAQFPLLEASLEALGVRVWAMHELEADDALASAAAVAAEDPAVEQVVLLTADKDLAQCVSGHRVVQAERGRKNGGRWQVVDEASVWARFGVGPESIPDYLALVGDAADGLPGIPGWGPKTAATVLARWRHVEQIPRLPKDWGVEVRGAVRLAAVLTEQMDRALLFRDLATLRVDRSLLGGVEELRWRGAPASFAEACARLGAEPVARRAAALGTR